MGTVAIAASTTSTSKSGSISTLDVANSAPTVVLASCEIGPQIRWKGRWVEGRSARSASASVGNEDATDIVHRQVAPMREKSGVAPDCPGYTHNNTGLIAKCGFYCPSAETRARGLYQGM